MNEIIMYCCLVKYRKGNPEPPEYAPEWKDMSNIKTVASGMFVV